jgi:hypothetical protein
VEGELPTVVRAVWINGAFASIKECARTVSVFQDQSGVLVRTSPDNQSVREIALEIWDLLLEQLRLAQAAELTFIYANELVPLQFGEVNR